MTKINWKPGEPITELGDYKTGGEKFTVVFISPHDKDYPILGVWSYEDGNSNCGWFNRDGSQSLSGVRQITGVWEEPKPAPKFVEEWCCMEHYNMQSRREGAVNVVCDGFVQGTRPPGFKVEITGTGYNGVRMLIEESALEKKPEPKKYDLSQMWRGWCEGVGGSVYASSYVHRSKSEVRQLAPALMKIIAITRADATTFYEGEGLDE
jgi:hypothetical protein